MNVCTINVGGTIVRLSLMLMLMASDLGCGELSIHHDGRKPSLRRGEDWSCGHLWSLRDGQSVLREELVAGRARIGFEHCSRFLVGVLG